ncbi:60S ribosomal protein L16A [Conglomerata obtusa]
MQQHLVINGTNHIAGRLASKIAKNLLEGTQVTVLFAENITYAFPLARARKIYESYLHKRCVVNPRKGPYHYVEPSKYFTRMVKRMLPHKKTKGANALKRLSVYESCPDEFQCVEKVVNAECLRDFKSNPIRKFCTFGELLKDFGWKRFDNAKEMEKKYEIENQKRIGELNEKKNALECFKRSEEFKAEIKRRLENIE